MELEAAARSDGGRVRTRNEDAYLLRPEKRLFAVADGMGGHQAGHLASRLAVDTLDAEVETRHADVRSLADRLVLAARAANRVILERANAERGTEGMGTTLTALALAADRAAIAHIGDSRAYRLRNGMLAQLTHDHTWVQGQVAAGRLSPDDVRGHPYANVLSRVLGMEDIEDADRLLIDVIPGDVFLLCSDGLTTMLEDDVIADILASDVPVAERASALIDAANARGGVDNITAVVVRIA
jgi:protein phosphatase